MNELLAEAEMALDVEPAHADAAPVIRCDGLRVGYGGEALLPPIDIELRRGTTTAVLGRNGCGKSTWFKTLLGILRPVGGEVVHLERGLRLAYVPQSAGLDAILPLTARDVVAQGRLSGLRFLRPWASRLDRRRVREALEASAAEELAERLFRDLSKGQKQRVLFARMLATEADVVLLDEPTAAMDVTAEREAIAALGRLSRERNMAVLVVTHALEAVTAACDELLIFDRVRQRVVHGSAVEIRDSEAFAHLRGELA